MASPNQTSGLLFPISLVGGKPPISSGIDLIHASLQIILSWPMFTRFYESEFGSRIHEVIEEPNDDILINLVNRFVIDAISTWEQRIHLIETSIEKPSMDKLRVTLVYRIKELNIEDTFYYNYPNN